MGNVEVRVFILFSMFCFQVFLFDCLGKFIVFSSLLFNVIVNCMLVVVLKGNDGDNCKDSENLLFEVKYNGNCNVGVFLVFSKVWGLIVVCIVVLVCLCNDIWCYLFVLLFRMVVLVVLVVM